MDKVYDHRKVEDGIYKAWEENGFFKPEANKKAFDSNNPDDKFAIILPPPNANGALHFGHAMFTVEDILIRFNRMRGKATLWLPGTDHAGIETQFVFEKKLKEQGKSRLDYDQKTLFSMIHEYVEEHRGGIQGQLKKLGFSLDWSREKYTLDPDIIKLVYKTFHRMYNDGLIYRDYKLVNYCTFDGTSFSDLEVTHEERPRPLYYIKYGPLVLATTRPETKFGDTAVAVHPDDKRYKKYVGQEIDIETVLGTAKIKVISDEMVDPAFGTGVVKITPAHDFNDFETGKRHNLPMKQVISFEGKMNEHAGKFAGMYVKEARKAVVEEMEKKGLLEKIDENYVTNLNLCYKCKNVLEPLPLEQWFIKVKPLADKAISAVKEGETNITPKNFETIYFQWLENLRDWNISRQIVWGIQIPAWKCDDCDAWQVTEGETPTQCSECKSLKITQDSDTFDTWFSSGQWPYVTLKTSGKNDFEKFYPTSVMETAYDILKAWVTRMMMLGIYITDESPFKDVLFHGIVNDPHGKKMSKSKGNVVNPLELVESYGADAVRFALVYGNATGNDQALSYTKLDAARKFTNKLWNMARFIQMKKEGRSIDYKKNLKDIFEKPCHENDKEWIEKTNILIGEITKYVESFQFNLAAERLYEFMWHEFADIYIEDVKNRIDDTSFLALVSLFMVQLKLLHPIMPFITEEIARELGIESEMLIISSWPEA